MPAVPALPALKVMKRAAPIAMALVVMATAARLLGAAGASADDYRFPIANPLKSSLIPAGYHPHRPNYLVSLLEVRADRRNVPRFERKNKLVLALFSQGGPAHLVFVIPGVGSYALSESALMLAEQFHGMGFHSVTLPDPLSWQYALGVSESTLPGYLPLDAGEYYELLKRVAEHLKREHRLGITGYSVAGYSFGGLLTGFLARLDGERRAFDFERAVVINPAIDIRHAIQVVDGFFASGHSILESRKSKLLSSMVDGVIRLRNRPLTDDLVRWAVDQWAFSDDEMKWMIGRSFRGATMGTIFASRQIRAHRLLAPPESPERHPRRVDQASRFSFGDYLSQFVFPSLRHSGSVHLPDEQLLERASLGALAPELSANPRVFVVENVDDFLARPEDIEALKSWLGPRLYLYPQGGHLGNLWYGKNQEDLRRIMSPIVAAR